MCLGILCLLLVACGSNGDADDTDTTSQGPAIDPDEFALSLEDKSTNKNNFVVVKITPGSLNMNLGEFLVTASIVDNKGIVRGATNKKGGKGFDYTADLNGCSIATLSYSTLKAKQENQGQPIKFKAQAIPGATIKRGDRYTLDVKIEYKGDHPHTATQSITLTAQQDGVDIDTEGKTEETSTSDDSNTSSQQNGADTKGQTGERSASGTSSQTIATTLGTISSNPTQPISHPTSSEDLPTLTEETTTRETSQRMLVADTDLPAAQNSEVPNAHAGQRADACDSTTIAPSTNTNNTTPASSKFTVTLKGETHSNYTKNFVLVTIEPGSSGMMLKDFAVTAHLENNLGVVRGSSRRNSSGFVYDKELNNCNPEELFLINKQSNCLGKNDTSFTESKAVSFKIEIRPNATIKQGDQYTLTVKVERKGGNPHTATQSITLTAPQKSPVKGQKRK